jgi:flagellar biogenesis protein FliO
MRQTQGLADSIIVDAKDPMQATIRLFQSMLGFLNGELGLIVYLMFLLSRIMDYSETLKRLEKQKKIEGGQGHVV